MLCDAPERILSSSSHNIWATAGDKASETVEIEIRVIPRARHNQVDGERAGRLVVRTTAAPVDDRANQAVCDLVAAHFGISRRRVTIVAGHRSRDKTLRIDPG